MSAVKWRSLKRLMLLTVVVLCIALVAACDAFDDLEAEEESQEELSAQLDANKETTNLAAGEKKIHAIGLNDGEALLDLAPGDLVEVTGLVVYLAPDNFINDGTTHTSFILVVRDLDGKRLDVTGPSFYGRYSDLIEEYPDIRASGRQIGPDKRDYLMTVKGIYCGPKIGEESGSVFGANLNEVEMEKLAPI